MSLGRTLPTLLSSLSLCVWACVPSEPGGAAPPGATSTPRTMEERMALLEAQLPRLRGIQERYEASLLTEPGFTSIGVGLLETGDDAVLPVFRVVVTEQALLERLPSEVEGVPLEATLGGPVQLMDGGPTCNGGAGPPCHRNQLPLPVAMGNSGAWFLGSACTMGFKACDLGTLQSVMVTNSHCAQYATSCALAGIGDPVKHVSPMDDPMPSTAVTIGTIAGHAAPVCSTSANNYVDATKVTSAFYQTSRSHRDIGTPPSTLVNPLPGCPVQYSGRTTGHNTGTVSAINVTVVVPATGGYCCGQVVMKDQISFKPRFTIMGGDSGSGLLIDIPSQASLDNRLTGLVFGYDGTLGYANNISRVLTALNVTLDFTRCGFPSQ